MLSSTLCSLCLLIPTAPPADWAQWRGPTRDSQVGGPTWPARLTESNLQKLWSFELGDGYPGPIVTNTRVFVAETVDKRYEQVRALDRKTGKEIWRYQWEGSMTVPFFARRNGDWIRSTPVYDGENLIVAGMRDVLVCLNPETGKSRWRVDFTERYKTPLPAFGFASSPMVDDTGVYVQAGASFVKLDKKTGETIWRTLVDGGGMYGSAFASPYRSKLAGKDQLLVQTRTELAGVDPASGKVLWSQKIPATRGMNILTPTVHNGKVFTSAYGAKTYLFEISPNSDSLAVREAWTNKAQANMSSPVIIGDHAYMHLLNRRFTCIELKTGKECWTTKPYGEYWSMVAQKDRILALDQDGTLYLIKANPEKFDLVDQVKISKEETWGHLAISGDEIFIRRLKGLDVYRWTEVKPTTPGQP